MGTVVGAAVSISTVVIASKNATSLQSTAAILERKEKSRAFQRDTLLELQHAVQDRSSGSWGRNLLGEELNNRVHLAGIRTLLLTERVADDGLRDHIKSLRNLLAKVQIETDSAIAKSAYLTAINMGILIMEHIGRLLRSLYPSS
ncbi:conserved protein of unknown function [Acidithiobacillus ferrivorans]|uniref:Uncharacterized protein n=1 Tax=Acidithiobacillus ferrivorans TaxID=160808 RepID=A0ABY1MRZ2_9PROT|nr:conserved protein of unknown function [Acidithiobacillus ferrivorans]